MLTLRDIMCLLVVVSEELEVELVFIFLTFNLTLKVTFTSNFQEPHKLTQPIDKTLKTMAIEFAEYHVIYFFREITFSMLFSYIYF
ncbi:hypothetical protein Hanom_Chr07g00616751 [Helianthus anomalus]